MNSTINCIAVIGKQVRVKKLRYYAYHLVLSDCRLSSSRIIRYS
jgi:hypothetical protein